MKRVRISFVSLAASVLLVVSTVCALPANLVLESFDSRGGPNKLGGRSDVWNERGGTVAAGFVKNDEVTAGFERPFNGYSLRLKYMVDGSRKESGWWSSLMNADYSSYGALSFWIRGESGGENFLVGLKDSGWFESKLSIGKYLPGGVKTTWQKVTIPLADFKEVRNWKTLDNFSITFSFEQGAPFSGTVYFDNIEFVYTGEQAPATPPPSAAAAIEKPDLAHMDNEQYLDLVEKLAFRYFWNEANPKNGLVKDLCNAFREDNYPVCSIAAVGFGLASICVAEKRGWVTRQEAYDRILTTMKYFRDNVAQTHGFYYHYLNMRTGERMYDCEVSSIDTALFLAGALFAGQYFEGTDIQQVAKELYERTDWRWLVNDEGFISMGWKPEGGFLPHSWNSYNELMILYMLAIGSPTYPVSPAVWSRFARPKIGIEKYTFVGIPPLFAHQYSHIWVNFRNKRDAFMDYYENSVIATLANREWCIRNKSNFKGFSPDCWGLTASDGPKGYGVYGAPNGYCDGTIAPTAALGSIVFTPKLSMRAMRHFYETYGDKVWGRYGFTDSFNPQQNWYSEKNIGIDQGPIVLMIENYRTGLIWKQFMKLDCIRQALELCGFTKARSVTNLHAPYEYSKGRYVNSKTVCPFCKKPLWGKGMKKRKSYSRCPNCLKPY